MHVADSSKNAIHGAFKFMCATFKNKLNEKSRFFRRLDSGRRRDTETTTRALLIRLSESWNLEEVCLQGTDGGRDQGSSTDWRWKMTRIRVCEVAAAVSKAFLVVVADFNPKTCPAGSQLSSNALPSFDTTQTPAIKSEIFWSCLRPRVKKISTLIPGTHEEWCRQ